MNNGELEDDSDRLYFGVWVDSFPLSALSLLLPHGL